MDVVIKVTQEDINRGKPCRSLCCPVASAAGRCLPYGRLVAVSCGQLLVLAVPRGAVEGDPASVAIPLPPDESDRIRRYDATGVMSPHEFTVSIPDPVTAPERMNAR